MEHLEHRKKVTIMIAIMSVMLFAALNMTVVGTSLPKIIADIGGMEYFNWAFTIYMLTSSITAILVGKLSDIYGRKIFILSGIGLFMTGSLLCGFSETIFHLIVYRGIQGFGGGMIISSAMTTIGDLFSARERGRWQGLMGGVFGFSSLFGPTVGGVIVDHMDWSWVFWIFLPIGIVAFIMIFKLYPTVEKKEREKIDFIGSTVLAVMILTLLLGFSWAGTDYHWLSFQIIGLFTLSFLSFLLFLWIETKVASPVIPLHLFKNKIVSTSSIISFLSGMGMFGVIMYVPFYVQGVLGRSATTSGLVEMVMTIVMMSCSITTGQLITKTGKYKIFALVGFAIMGTGVFLSALLPVNAGVTQLLFYLIIIGVGLGLTMPIFTLTVQNAVEHKFLGVVTATAQLFRHIGGTIGVALMGYVLSVQMAAKMAEADLSDIPEAASGEISLSNPEYLLDEAAIEETRATLSEAMQPYFEQLLLIVRESLHHGITQVFLFCTVAVIIAFICTLTLKEIPLKTSNEPAPKEGGLKQSTH